MRGSSRLLLWVLVAMVVSGYSFCGFRPSVLSRISSTLTTMSSPPSSWSTIWLHGLGDNGPNNAPLRHSFNFPNMKWHFPSAPNQPVTCNNGFVMPSWFDIQEIPIAADSPNDEEDLLVAVRKIHEMLNKQVEDGIPADRIFLCGFSQGGALTLASALSYSRKLAGAVVFSGWVPFNETFFEKAREGKQTPLLWLHGTSDQVVHFKAGQVAPTLLANHDINCEFKAFHGLGHSISPEELAYLNAWMKLRIA